MKTRIPCAISVLLLMALTWLTAWQQTGLVLAQRGFDRWINNPSAPERVSLPLQGALSLPDPSAWWLQARWHLARNPADPQVLDLLAQIEKARPYDYRPALARARWWAENDPANPQMGQAIAQAIDLGPNESRVFAAVFPLGRLHWHYLDPGLRQRLEALLVSTAIREPAYAIELARDYGLAAAACEMTADNLLAQGHCQRLGIVQSEKESP